MTKTKQVIRLETEVAALKLELKEIKHLLKDDTFTGSTFLTLGDNDIPIKVRVNIKTRSIEFAEIDNEAINTAQMNK